MTSEQHYPLSCISLCLMLAVLMVIGSCDTSDTQTGQGDGPTRCTRVFIRADTSQLSKYRIYLPRFEQQMYSHSEFTFVYGDTEYAYRILDNVHTDKPKEGYPNKLVSHKTYIEHCKDAFFQKDTLYFVVDMGDTYREIDVQSWEIRTLKNDILTSKPGRSADEAQILIDYSRPAGYAEVNETGDTLWSKTEVDSVACYTLHKVRRFTADDTITEVYVKGLGFFLRNSDRGELSRISFAGKGVAEALSGLCD